MKGKQKFYCTSCKHFLGRTDVVHDTYENRFFCKFCDNSVIITEKVVKSWIEECIEYIVKQGKEDDFQ